MAFMAFTGYINVYIVRNNINLAIVAMVNYTAIREEVNPSNDSLIPEEKQCEFQTVNSTDTSEDGPFPWSEPIQALISTSFLWGYFITNIPGGRLAEIFGTKYLLAISQILASALTMLIPIAASVGWELIIVIRVTMGLVQGPSFPCMHPLLAKWIPPQERGTISAVVYAGQQLGTVVGLLLTGLIINKLGWEAVFYIEGCIGFVWTFFWLLLVFDSPDTHPRISKAEKKYIRTSIANDASPTKKVASVPWKDIFTSLPFYAILIANIGHNWGFLILLTELPIYMKNILGFDIKSNSMATAFPYFLTWLASIAVSPLADLCKQKEWLSTVWIRKIFTLIGHMGPAVCLTAVAFAGCDLTLILVMLTLSVSLQAGIYAGWFINHIDIASNFAANHRSLANSFSIGCCCSWL
ncbi:hypothetical protein QYM36_009564 [Artemia franciscana]|uniref:Major facilitator superfamily (MFS) profile domain-containing protein n=2 Tax=Artemia franciscana TaxID=6661 RepID=A0AA88HTW3_ARTSF|nr:hypothetical protein QYM36_009564 [Artemia franciscana]